MRRFLVLIAGALGLGALLRRRRSSRLAIDLGPTPADDLRAKLAETRAAPVGEPAAEEPARDELSLEEPPPEPQAEDEQAEDEQAEDEQAEDGEAEVTLDPDFRRRVVHDWVRETIDELR